MQNRAELLRLFDQEQRINIEYPGMTKTTLPNLVRFVRPAPGMSFVLYSHLDEANADVAITEQVGYFTQLNQPFNWKVYDHDTPPDMLKRLAAHGFTQQDPDAVMYLDLHSAPAALLQPITMDVRRLTQQEQLADVITVESQVWGGDFNWIDARLGGHMAIPGYVSIYVAYHNDTPACAAWVYYHPNSLFADLWGGSTIPAFRKQGLYTAILAARVQEAYSRGVRYLTIDASPMSQPILAKHGFQVITTAQDCEWQPPQAMT